MKFKILIGASCFAVAVSSIPAFAQDAPATTEAEQLQDIVVTANKRETRLQDAPVAVTAVSAETLKSLNVNSVTELTRIAPGLSFIQAPSPQSSQFTIRGVGTYAFNDGLEQSVGVVVDGIPMARLVGSLGDIVDVGQIQVLRGPQGTIFGKNATAGVIDVSSTDATFETSLNARGFLGTHAERRIQATGNIPIIADKLAVRVSGWAFGRDGYIRAPLQPDGNIGDFRARGARLKVAIAPTDTWRIDLTAEHNRMSIDGTIVTNRGYLSTDVIRQFDVALGIVAGPDNRTTAKDFPEGGVTKQDRFVAKSVVDLGGASLTALAGYIDTKNDARYDFDYTDSRTAPQPSLSHYLAEYEQFTTEIRLANESTSKFRYTVGLFYYDLDIDSLQAQQNLRLAAPFTGSDSFIRVKTKNYAAFADLSYDIGKLTLLAGARYSEEKTRGSYDRLASTEFPRPTVLNGVLSVRNPYHKYDNFSWRLGGQYHFSRDVMLYGTVSTAYKGPGLNYTLSLTQAQFNINQGIVNAETVKSYELGLRSQLFDRQLTLNLTGFYSPFKDFQVTALLPTTPPTFTTVNANKLVAQGVELEFAIQPRALEGFSVSGNLVYNDSHYGDFKNAPCFLGQVQSAVPTSQPGICAPIAVGSTVLQQNVSGFRTVGAPKWQANVRAGYERDFGSLRGFGQVYYTYNGATQFQVSNNPVTIQKAFSLVDLTAGFGAADRSWTITGYVRNLFDKQFVGRISYANPGIGQTIPFQSLRSFGVALDVAF